MNTIIRTFGYLLRIISNLILVILLVMVLVPVFKPYIKDYESYEILTWTAQVDSRIQLKIKETASKILPTSIGDIDLSRLYLIVIIFLLSGLVNKIGFYLEDIAFYMQKKREIETWEDEEISSAKYKKVSAITHKIKQIKNTESKSRREIIQDIMSLKEQLDEMKQSLAFLAIDVVGSTAMKQQETQLDIQYDFDRYNEIVTEILEKNHCVKYTTTPDGIMAAFREIAEAVISAQTLLAELKPFNEKTKKMKRKFAVRIGINSGSVIFDDSEPLENLSDAVVDIAGHMQKHADPDTIYMSEFSYNELKEHKKNFVNIDKTIDEEKVYRWSFENLQNKG